MRNGKMHKGSAPSFILPLFFFVLCIVSGPALAHEESRPQAIVDTDMAMDDVRALVILLNSEAVEPLLAVTSDGSTSPQAGARSLKELLRYFNKADVPVAMGRELGREPPAWRGLTEDLLWGELPREPTERPASQAGAAQEIVRVLKSVGKPILYLCLGPLSNLSEALSLVPDSKEKISALVYFGGHPDDPSPGWNTRRDPEAVRKVLASGLRVYSLNIPEDQWPRFDQRLCDQIRTLRTPAAQLVVRLHEKAQVKTLMAKGHFGIWDEAVVLYLRNPSAFLFQPKTGSPWVMDLIHVDRDSLEDLYVNSLGSGADLHLSPRSTVLLKVFPINPSELKADVAAHAQNIIGRHGLEEWKACLLTSELHRHLGTYSLMGAKMGIRAREILNAPFDTLKVASYAGMAPPLSCMNDGLQVSTGASLGRGAIDVSKERKEPKAVFIYGQEKISLALKPFWTEKIKGDMRAAVKTYGETGPAYFDHVRRLSIQYWLELDRDEIFDVENLSQTSQRQGKW